MAPISDKVKAQLQGTDARAIVIVTCVDAHAQAAAPEGTRAEKAQAVHDAKVANADASQKEVKELLDARHVTYKSFWINNSLAVEADWKLVEALAALPTVAHIDPNEGGASILQ